MDSVVKFEICWKITPADVESISTKSITKSFVTAYKNVVLNWRMELDFVARYTFGFDCSRVNFGIIYEDGPKTQVELLYQPYCRIPSDAVHPSVSCKISRGERHAQMNFMTLRNFKASRGSEPIVVVMKISSDAFSGFEKLPESPESPSWVIDMYQNIESPNSECSDVQLISGDGKAFYCHKVVLIKQSDQLKAMFAHATSEEEKNGIFRFRATNNDVLKAAVQFLYTGQVTLSESSTAMILELVDFSEQYGLKILKEMVHQRAWNLVLEKPMECLQVARFADLHSETGLKPLKDRCFDILAENYENLELKISEMFQSLGPRRKKIARKSTDGGIGRDQNDQDKKLGEEFALFLSRRVTPNVYSG